MKYIISITFLLSTSLIFSQNTKKVVGYYDSEQRLIQSVHHVLVSNPLVFQGKYEEYYRSQRLLMSGQYEQGVPVGKWAYFYENGFRKMEAFLDSTNRTYWKYYFENDSLKMEGFIENKNKVGNWVFYNEDGSVKSRGEFVEGKKHGLWEHYYPDGTIKAIANYIMGEGTYTEYYYEGPIMRTGPTKNNYSHGIWTYFYEDGAVQAKGPKNNGLKDGVWEYYHENGKISGKGRYDSGNQVGEWVYYHDNGEVSSKGELIAGKKEGRWNLYNTNGEFKGEAIFHLGNGTYKEYYSSGDLKVQGEIVNGKSDGLWKYYYQDGSLEGQCEFYEGRGEYIGFYPSSDNVQMKGIIEYGKKVGVWTLYDINGEEAGYYKTIHAHDNTASYKNIDELEQHDDVDTAKTETVNNSDLPDYVKPKKPKRRKNLNSGIRKLYYFKPHRHEYRSVIVSANPLGIIYGSVPFALEYHFQDRLGYELMYSWLDFPAFRPINKMDEGTLWRRGSAVEFKQKLYNPTKGMGHLYFGQSLGYTNISYGAKIEVQNQIRELRSQNNEVYYSLFVGNRLGTYYYHGVVFDIYLGLGIGYRWHDQNYENGNDVIDEVFSPVDTKSIFLKPNFGFTFGYLF